MNVHCDEFLKGPLNLKKCYMCMGTEFTHNNYCFSCGMNNNSDAKAFSNIVYESSNILISFE